MRFKPIPEPPDDPAFLADAQRAVPVVPGTEDDCCARLMGRTGVAARDDARTWLTFLRALRLAEETDAGFVRTGVEPDADAGAVAEAFEERVFGAREVLEILETADSPLDASAVFGRFEPVVPEWERHREPGRWRETWTERVERLLAWAVLLGLAERTDGGVVAG